MSKIKETNTTFQLFQRVYVGKHGIYGNVIAIIPALHETVYIVDSDEEGRQIHLESELF